ncbi:LAME_0H06304g1_1 [Lachancea meyersii CBS 8951]|uniref:LAME_0H06304g1_1 n=1 Tax=Lachancea meyersii CBS 8951 TaxID=1266667 RepID=A0A1G4KEH6_9SACH|nr:LAME_0H06304g1_1 [Lachancea meyersii CBS 8951]
MLLRDGNRDSMRRTNSRVPEGSQDDTFELIGDVNSRILDEGQGQQNEQDHIQPQLRQGMANLNSELQAMRDRSVPQRNQDQRRARWVDEHNQRWPPVALRRHYLRLFLRNLLLLDHLLMVFLFPFSVYNVLKILLAEVTFSNSDFVADIATYCHYSNILSEDGRSVVFFKSGFGLLGKFHNIIVYYSAPLFVWASSKAALGTWVIKAYVSLIKTTAVTLYTVYGVGTSVYVCFATFFFALCLLMTGFRRYKGAARIMGHLYRTMVGVF